MKKIYDMAMFKRAIETTIPMILLQGFLVIVLTVFHSWRFAAISVLIYAIVDVMLVKPKRTESTGGGNE